MGVDVMDGRAARETPPTIKYACDCAYLRPPEVQLLLRLPQSRLRRVGRLGRVLLIGGIVSLGGSYCLSCLCSLLPIPAPLLPQSLRQGRNRYRPLGKHPG